MPPRRELNNRFQSYLKRDLLTRRLVAGFLSGALLLGVGGAVAKISPSTFAAAGTSLATAGSASGETLSSALNEFGAFLASILYRDTVSTSDTPHENWNARSPKTDEPQATSSQALISPASSDAPPQPTTILSDSTRAYPGKVLGASAATITLPQPVQIPNDLVRAYTLAVLLASFEWDVNQKLAALENPPPFPQQVAAGGTTVIYQSAIPAAQRIDRLDNVVINNPTIIGGSISGTSGIGSSGGIGSDATTTTFFSTIGHFTTGIIDALSSTAATIANLGTAELIATNATTTNLYVSGAATIGSGTGVLQSTNGVVAALANGANGQVLKISGGVPAWGTDNSGSGGGSSAWATTTDSLAVYPATISNVILIGNSATTTTGNILEVKGDSLFRGTATAYQTITAPYFTATSSVASQLPYASTTAITATTASTTNLVVSSAAGGLLKTNAQGFVSIASPGTDYLNSTSGDWSGTLGGYSLAQLIAAGFSTTSADVYISQRNLFSTSSSDFFVTQRNFFSTTSADAFVAQRTFFSTSSTNYWKSVTDLFSTTSAIYFADASTSIPKTYTSNTFAGTQTFTNASTTNISSSYASSTAGFFGNLSIGSLSGFVKAVGGALTAAFIDLANNVTGILPVGNGGTGWASIASAAIPYGNGAGALATTTAGLPGQVLALLNSVPTWTSTTTFSSGLAYSNGNVILDTSGSWIGTLGGFTAPQLIAAGFSTTSADAFVSQRNFFSTTSTDYWKSATNFFATTSSDFWKTQNSFFSTSSADYFLAQNQGASFSTTSAIYFAHASTTIAKTYASNTFTGANVFSGSLTFGSLNGPLQANSGVLSATTSIGVLYGGTGLTSAPTYGQLLVGNSLGGYTLTATSSLGITGGSSLFTDGGNTTYLTSSDVLGIGTTTAASKLAVYGDIFAEGSNRYFNFGTATGTNGYGFRDNAGTLEFKNTGGTWQGVSTATSGPSFSVHKNGTNQTVTSNTPTLITFSTETFDTNNNFSSNRFTPTVPGKYMFAGHVYCTDNTDYCWIFIYKNGSEYAQSLSNDNQETIQGITAIIDMNGTSDYVELWAADGGGTVVGGASAKTNFASALIAPVNSNNAAGWTNDGTQSYLLDNSDLVGIGTTTPWGKLSIQSAADIPQFVIGSSTTQFIVDKNGNVGIGTTSPFTALGVQGTFFATSSSAQFAVGNPAVVAIDPSYTATGVMLRAAPSNPTVIVRLGTTNDTGSSFQVEDNSKNSRLSVAATGNTTICRVSSHLCYRQRHVGDKLLIIRSAIEGQHLDAHSNERPCGDQCAQSSRLHMEFLDAGQRVCVEHAIRLHCPRRAEGISKPRDRRRAHSLLQTRLSGARSTDGEGSSGTQPQARRPCLDKLGTRTRRQLIHQPLLFFPPCPYHHVVRRCRKRHHRLLRSRR